MPTITGNLRQAWRAGSSEGLAGWKLLIVPEPAVVTALKRAVPADCREYDPESHAWWIAIEWADHLRTVFPELEAYQRQMPLL